MDFFTVEVLTPETLATYYPKGRAPRGVLFCLHHESRKVHIAGLTMNPDETWRIAFGDCSAASPAFAGKDIYMRGRRKLYCIGPGTVRSARRNLTSVR